MDKTAEICRQAGYPEVARAYEHMKKYGHLTLPQTAELLDRYETALKRIIGGNHRCSTPRALLAWAQDEARAALSVCEAAPEDTKNGQD